MLVISCLAQKGGCSKSTLSRTIAVNYALAGWKVKIADMDLSQSTTTKWNTRRLAANYEPTLSVEQFNSPVQAINKTNGYNLLIFDGAPHSTRQTLEIAQNSNLVIIPTGTSVDDLEPTIALAHELRAKGISTQKIGIAFGRVGNSEAELLEAIEYVKQSGYFVFDGHIREKTAIRRALDVGKCATETPYNSINDHSANLVNSIAERLTEITK